MLKIISKKVYINNALAYVLKDLTFKAPFTKNNIQGL